MKRLIYLIIVMLFVNACTSPSDNSKNSSKKIKVGVFDGNGASPICVIETLEALKIDTEIEGFHISAYEIANGALDTIDVLIFPGGSGSKELNNLGNKGADIVKNYVKNGGKILGICAGGYILSSTPTYPSLKIASVKNIDRKHYSRGRGLIEVKLNESGHKIFPELKGHRTFFQYYDGPILAPVDSSNINFTTLATYVTDIHSNKGVPSGITPGKIFMLTEKIDKGQIFIFGGHPEATPGMRWMVARAVRYMTDGVIKKYDKWVHPDNYSHEIMFTSQLKKKEKNYFWKLLNDTAEVRLTAMDTLYAMRSRPAVRWNMGLLRDENPKVREHAAFLLMKTEYTAALPDILQTLNTEKNEETKKQLQQTADFLSNF